VRSRKLRPHGLRRVECAPAHGGYYLHAAREVPWPRS
jgi:hypothetical protein